MCFWGGSSKNSQPIAPPAPPAQSPIPSASEQSPGAAGEQRRARLAAMKYGMLNTIRNVGGAKGITGKGADLSTPIAQGQKTLLGS